MFAAATASITFTVAILAAALFTAIAPGWGSRASVASETGSVFLKEWHDFEAAVGGGDANMRDAFSYANGTGQANGRRATDADDGITA